MDPKEYGEKFSTTVMNGYVALEITIGHKLGLFIAHLSLATGKRHLSLATGKRLTYR
jgi:hypothetical protein